MMPPPHLYSPKEKHDSKEEDLARTKLQAMRDDERETAREDRLAEIGAR